MKVQKISGDWTRRKFLATTAAGAGIIVIPSFLAGCRGKTDLVSPGPETFGVYRPRFLGHKSVLRGLR